MSSAQEMHRELDRLKTIAQAVVTTLVMASSEYVFAQEEINNDFSMQVNGSCDPPRTFLDETTPVLGLGIRLHGDVRSLGGVFIAVIDLKKGESSRMFIDYFPPGDYRRYVTTMAAKEFSEVASENGDVSREEPILQNHQYRFEAWEGNLKGDRYSEAYIENGRYITGMDYITPDCNTQI